MKSFSILFGVCGIGRGHIYEMLPIIEYYVKRREYRVVIFAFGESFSYFQEKFHDCEKVRTFEVSIPWIHGGPSGLDYGLTARESMNNRSDFISRNFLAMEEAFKFIGKPSVVVTDYEPVSAMFAYSLGSPVVSIDQQSKYLLMGYPDELSGLTPNEERARLGMFFPHVDLRIVNSFFALPSSMDEKLVVSHAVYGPVIRDEIISMKTTMHEDSQKVLVYLSPYSTFVQNPSDVLQLFKQFPDFTFYLFTSLVKEYSELQARLNITNVRVDIHGDKNFLEALGACRSIISTAGHTLLSEAMYLEKPVFAIPLRTYEQHYSAKIIQDGGFGMTAKNLQFKNLRTFLDTLDHYEDAIQTNKDARLYREPAQVKIIEAISNFLKNREE